jgi:hypothetical protein
MRPTSIVRSVFAALCLAALFETTSGNLQADEPKCELAGFVVDLDGRPVPNAKVWLETPQWVHPWRRYRGTRP